MSSCIAAKRDLIQRSRSYSLHLTISKWPKKKKLKKKRESDLVWVCFTAMGLTTYPPPHPIILPRHPFENLKKSHSWTPTHPPTSFSPTVHLNQTKKSLGYFLKKFNIIKAQTETCILNFLDSDIWPIFIYDPKIAH